MRDALDQHTRRFHRLLRLNTLFGFCLSTLNAMLVTGTTGLAIFLWTQGRVEVGTVAMALPLAWQIVSMAGWVGMQVTSIFENIGVVQEGMMTIARPIGADRRARGRGARGAARRDRFSMTCASAMAASTLADDGSERPFAVIDDFTLTREAGRKGRTGRPLGRRQVDAGQSAAALLRSRGRPHPDRRAGYSRRSSRRACVRRFRW